VFERVLDQAEGCPTIREDAAEFAVQVGVIRRQRREGLGDRRVLVSPVVAASRKDFHAPGIEPGVHAVAVEFDLVEPLGAFWGLLDERRELRLYPGR
jgi:hypothetical protein